MQDEPAKGDCGAIALVPFEYNGSTIEMVYCDLMSLVKGARGSSDRDEAHIVAGRRYLNEGDAPYRVTVPARTLTSVLDSFAYRSWIFCPWTSKVMRVRFYVASISIGTRQNTFSWRPTTLRMSKAAWATGTILSLSFRIMTGCTAHDSAIADVGSSRVIPHFQPAGYDRAGDGGNSSGTATTPVHRCRRAARSAWRSRAM